MQLRPLADLSGKYDVAPRLEREEKNNVHIPDPSAPREGAFVGMVKLRDDHDEVSVLECRGMAAALQTDAVTHESRTDQTRTMVDKASRPDCGGRPREGPTMKKALLALMVLTSLAAPCLAQTTPPAAPTNLTVVFVDVSTAQLEWTDNAT